MKVGRFADMWTIECLDENMVKVHSWTTDNIEGVKGLAIQWILCEESEERICELLEDVL